MRVSKQAKKQASSKQADARINTQIERVGKEALARIAEGIE